MTSYSENIQMYLVHILRERQGDDPLPLPVLAEVMSISPASVNEMIKKLEAEGFVKYVPYAGVQLTKQGARLAAYILRRHRLWEVFLVERLGYGPDEAHEIACRLEHATPDQLADRLDEYLDRPRFNPDGEPIPEAAGQVPQIWECPLSALSPGLRAVVADIRGDDTERQYLGQKGITQGRALKVLAVDEHTMLLEAGEERLVIARELTEDVYVRTRSAEGCGQGEND